MAAGLFNPAAIGANVIHVQPSVLVSCSFLFGPLAGAVASVASLAGQFLLVEPNWRSGIELALVTWCVGNAGFLLYHRYRVNFWLALSAVVLLLPFALIPWARSVSVPSSSPWYLLHAVPWRYIVSAIVLSGGIGLLRSRLLTLQALQMRENELLQTIKASGGGRWDWNIALQQFGYQGAFFRNFGLDDSADDEAVSGARVMDREESARRLTLRVHPQDLPRLSSQMREAISGRSTTYHVEFRMLDMHHRWRWLIARGIAVQRDKLGRALRISGMVLDITAHRDMAEALRATEAKYRTFYETLPDAAGIVRLSDGSYIDVNPAFERLLRMPRDEIIGKTAEAIGIEIPANERGVLLERLRQEGSALALAMVVRRADLVVPGVVSARLARVDGENCVVFVFHNLSQERHVQDKLIASNHLLQQASRLARLGTWESVPGHGITTWSDITCEIHGLAPGSTPPRDYFDQYIAPAWREQVRAASLRHNAQGMVWNMEFEIVRADNGRHIWVRIRSEAVMHEGQVLKVRGILQDVDDFHRASERMLDSEARLAHIFQALPYPLSFARRSDGRFVDVNPAWEQATGYAREEAIGRTTVDLGIYSAQGRAQLMEAARKEGQVVGFESEMRTRHGEMRTVLQSLSPTDVGGDACWLYSVHDITERKHQEQQVREREEMLSLTISAAALGLWDWDLKSNMLRGDSRWNTLQGWPNDSDAPGLPRPWENGIFGEHLEAIREALKLHIAHPGTPFDVTWRVAPPHSTSRWLRNVGKVVAWSNEGVPLRMLGVTIDVTMQHEQQELLQHMAHYDALTGLPNRVLLAQRLAEAITGPDSTPQLHVGVVYIDLDALKAINDRLGHDMGDRLLVLVGARLQRALRSADTVARLSGDEFAVVMPALTDREHCERRLRTLVEAVMAPFQLGEDSVAITSSVGYTLFPEDNSDADTLLRHADQAMYIAKQAGGNRVRAFDTVKELARQSLVEQREELVKAMNNGELSIYLQPKVDMRTGVVVGAEALVRWVHPSMGVRLPGSFLHLVENTDLEARFSSWVMDASLGLIAQLNLEGMQLQISVNVVAEQLRQPGFADWVTARLAEYPSVNPQQLDLEITENAALYDINHVARELARVRMLGVSVSLDDFGTGYSSLSYLRRLPVDQLKLDQSYVLGMVNDSADHAIVQGIVGLAKSFGYGIVAEGVETVEQGLMLVRMGCVIAQGHGIAKPMPAERFTDWAATWQAPTAWLMASNIPAGDVPALAA